MLWADRKQTKHSVSVSDSSDVVVSDCCIQTNIHEGNQASIELSGMRFLPSFVSPNVATNNNFIRIEKLKITFYDIVSVPSRTKLNPK